jgi:hypothetical protein
MQSAIGGAEMTWEPVAKQAGPGGSGYPRLRVQKAGINAKRFVGNREAASVLTEEAVVLLTDDDKYALRAVKPSDPQKLARRVSAIGTGQVCISAPLDATLGDTYRLEPQNDIILLVPVE